MTESREELIAELAKKFEQSMERAMLRLLVQDFLKRQGTGLQAVLPKTLEGMEGLSPGTEAADFAEEAFQLALQAVLDKYTPEAETDEIEVRRL